MHTYAQQANDVDFCALIEHELYHIAHKKDEWGIPSYNRETGKPKLTIQGHDVEDISETKTICASAKVAVNLFIQKNIRGLSLRCMAEEFRLGKTYLDQMIFAGKYYLNGHNKKLRLE